MKKLLILLAVVFTANVMMAQKMDRTNAYNYNRNGQYEKAIESIEKCVNHEKFLGMKTKDQATAWFYRGNIYLNVYEDAALSAKYPNALDLAYESLQRCVSVDPSIAKENPEVYQKIAYIAVKFYQIGLDNYGNAKYPEAALDFRKSYEISLSGTPDTTALSNTAMSYKNAKMYEDALKNYEELRSLGYNAPDLYQNMASCYLGLENHDKTLEIIEAGLEQYPGHPGMIIEKVNLFLKEGKGAEAVNDLNKLYEMDPNNASILFALGDIYDNEESELYDADKAIGYYNEALKVDSTYYDAAYNLVAVYVDLSNKKNAEADEKLSKGFNSKIAAEADALVKEGDAYLELALPHAERSFDMQPSKEMGQVLSSIYVRLKMNDKAAALKARMEEL